jgi:hypothetical protein
MYSLLGWLAAGWMLACAGCGDGGRDVEPTANKNAADSAMRATDAKTVESPTVPQAIRLGIHVGDRFPLVKRLDQFLKQVTPNGNVLTHHSSLEMSLSMTVEELIERGPRNGQLRLGARFHHVKFSQNVPGVETHYDSDNPPATVPLEIMGYHGLKDNGFSFWIGADHQILEIVDFDKFIDRCVVNVPADKRVFVRSSLARSAGADGIANFIDDSIGLLPNRAVALGDSWTRSRQIVQPVPMHISTRYTLTELTSDEAQVNILGTITPSTTYGPDDQQSRGVEVQVKKGHSIGSCTINRRTGLPIDSRVDQELSMRVKLANKVEFDQFKTTVTTIRIYPASKIERAAANGKRKAN